MSSNKLSELRDQLQYDVPLCDLDDDKYSILPMRSSWYVKVKNERGEDRVYSCAFPENQWDDRPYVFRMIGKGNKTTLTFISPKTARRIAEQYFSDQLMENML